MFTAASWPDLFRPSTSSGLACLKTWMSATSAGMTKSDRDPIEQCDNWEKLPAAGRLLLGDSALFLVLWTSILVSSSLSLYRMASRPEPLPCRALP
jgi:hypothetical protein